MGDRWKCSRKTPNRSSSRTIHGPGAHRSTRPTARVGMEGSAVALVLSSSSMMMTHEGEAGEGEALIVRPRGVGNGRDNTIRHFPPPLLCNTSARSTRPRGVTFCHQRAPVHPLRLHPLPMIPRKHSAAGGWAQSESGSRTAVLSIGSADDPSASHRGTRHARQFPNPQDSGAPGRGFRNDAQPADGLGQNRATPTEIASSRSLPDQDKVFT